MRPILISFLFLTVVYPIHGQQQALRFSAPGDYLEIPHSPSLSPAAITIEMYIRADQNVLNSNNGEQSLIDKRDFRFDPWTGYQLRLAGPATPLNVISNFPNSPLDPATGHLGAWGLIELHRWYHIATTHDGSVNRIYVNGVLVASAAGVYNQGSTIPMRIGDITWSEYQSLVFHGDLDEIRIWNHVRSESDIRSTMTHPLTGQEAGLAALWSFDNDTGPIIYDKSPNGNHGQLHGNAHLVESEFPVGPPANPTPVSPIDGATNVATTPMLMWTHADHIGTYHLQISTESSFSSLLVDQANIAATSFGATGLAGNSLYYWRVRAISSIGISEWSPVSSFTTESVFPTLWERSFKNGTLPDWIPSNWTVNRGVAIGIVGGKRRAYAVRSQVNALSVRILDLITGADLGTLPLDGVSGGVTVLSSQVDLAVSDVEVSSDGLIFVSNVTTSATGPNGPFKVYKWTAEDQSPELVISYNEKPYRLGDRITVVGSAADNSLTLYTAATNTNKVLRFTTTDGAESFTVEEITLSDQIMNASPSVAPLTTGRSSFYVNSNGAQGTVRLYDPTGIHLGTVDINLVGGTGNNAIKYFEFGGSRYLVTYQYSGGKENGLVLDVSAGPGLAQRVGVTNPMFAGLAVSGAGDVAVHIPSPHAVDFYVIAARNGIGAYRMGDATPPIVTLADLRTLWPANRTMETITLEDIVLSIQDDQAGSIPVSQARIVAVSSDEPTKNSSNPNTEQDIIISNDCRSVQLRVDRDGRGNGRVYTVHLEVSDPSGNSQTAQYKIIVPRDQGKGHEVVDDGPSYVVESICAPPTAPSFAQTSSAKKELPKKANASTPEMRLESYPNPFNPSTRIQFELPVGDRVTLSVYNMLGQQVVRLLDEFLPAGRYARDFDASRLSAGTYYGVLRTSERTIVHKMLLVK